MKTKILGLLVVGSLAATSVSAASTVYFGEDLNAANSGLSNTLTAQAAFLGALSSYGTDGLEGVTAPTFVSGLSFGATGITGTLNASTPVRSGVDGQGRFPVDGSNYLLTAGNRRINFSSPVSAFGLFVIDANELDNDPATATIGGQLLTQAQIDARPFGSIDGIFRIITERSPGNFELLFDGGTFPTDGSAMYVGLIDSANPFANIILINGTAGLDGQWWDNFGYDALTVGTVSTVGVPEPGTLVLLGLGLAGLGLSRRRKAN